MSISSFIQRIGIIGTGHSISFLVNNLFDYVLYVPVVAYFGPIKGCGIMIALSILINLILLKVYDWTGKDWLGLESLKKGKENLNSLSGWMGNLLKAGDGIAFIALSFYDPLFTVIYMRKPENVYKGLSKRDWVIFGFATVLSNIGWTTLVFGGLSVVRFIMHVIGLPAWF